MNIRPMDMQVLIPRATDVAKSQQLNDQQSMQQQQFAAEWKKIADVRQNQVQSSSKTEGEKVKAKEERESRKKHQEQEKEESEQAAKETLEHTVNQPSADDPLRGHRIDIKM